MRVTVNIMSVARRTFPASGQQLQLAEAMLERLPEFADRLAERLSEEDGFYREVNSSAPQELRRVCAANLRRALETFLEGTELALDAVRKTGRAQARQGIPLLAVLRAFRIAGTFAYETLLQRAETGVIDTAQTVEISEMVWRIIDEYSEALADAYRDVEAERTQQQEELRTRLLDDLLEGRATRQSDLDQAADALGLRHGGTLVVVVAEEPQTGGNDTRVSPAGIRASALVRSRRWRSAWRVDSGRETGIVLIERSGELSRLRNELASTSLAIGLSKPCTELGEVPGALHRARLARCCIPAGRHGLVVFGEQPVTLMVAASPGLAMEIARDVFGELLAQPSTDRDTLLKTLSAWFVGSGTAREAAASLFVHPNTVRYRIRRIEEMTKRRLADPVGTAELYLALQAIRTRPSGS